MRKRPARITLFRNFSSASIQLLGKFLHLTTPAFLSNLISRGLLCKTPHLATITFTIWPATHCHPFPFLYIFTHYVLPSHLHYPCDPFPTSSRPVSLPPNPQGQMYIGKLLVKWRLFLLNYTLTASISIRICYLLTSLNHIFTPPPLHGFPPTLIFTGKLLKSTALFLLRLTITSFSTRQYIHLLNFRCFKCMLT